MFSLSPYAKRADFPSSTAMHAHAAGRPQQQHVMVPLDGRKIKDERDLTPLLQRVNYAARGCAGGLRVGTAAVL
jgi:hypothetical protein